MAPVKASFFESGDQKSVLAKPSPRLTRLTRSCRRSKSMATPVDFLTGAFESPRELVRTNAYCEEELIGPAYHEYFRLHRLRGHGDMSWPGGELMLLIVVTGEANLLCGDQRQPVRAGQTLLLPGAAQSWNWTQPSGDWEILLAKLPVVQSSSRHP